MGGDGQWRNDSTLSWNNPGFEQTAEHPVVCVSWEDARAYAKWLREKTGRSYRLLTEAEYEYIVRADSTTAFAWGASGEDMCAHANGFDASARGAHPDWPGASCDDGYVYTAPVRALPANAFGVDGAVGNIFQWTEDCFVEGGTTGHRRAALPVWWRDVNFALSEAALGSIALVGAVQRCVIETVREIIIRMSGSALPVSYECAADNGR
jgi:formylglycine-generating enzyme required for sulfatase activity